MRAIPLAIGLLLATVAVPPGVAPGGEPLAVVGVLPLPLAFPSAAYDGERVLVFGGAHGGDRSDAILVVDPATGQSTVAGATLPTPRDRTAAAYDGRYAYVLGGHDGTFLNDIVRYDPVADEAVLLPVELPRAVIDAAAVWTGTRVYVFGGSTADIQWFEPATGSAGLAAADLPRQRDEVSAVWDGRHAYVFGGWNSASPGGMSEIVRYDPVADVAVLAGRLDVAQSMTSAAFDGRYAYVFGGGGYVGTESARIQRYDPVTQDVVVMHGLLPTVRIGTAAAWTEAGAIVVGGLARFRTLDEVVRYVPGSDAPNGMPIAEIAPGPTDFECVEGVAFIPFEGSGRDPDGDPLRLTWRPFGFASSPSDTGPTTTQRYRLGAHSMGLEADDGREVGRAVRGVRVVDTGPPTLSVSRPEPGRFYLFDEPQDGPSPIGSTLAVGQLTIEANASDLCGFEHVRFELPEEEPVVDRFPPFRATLNLPVGDSAGPVAIRVVARDLGGHEVEQIVEVVHVSTRTADLPRAFGPLRALCHDEELDLAAECEGLFGHPRPT